MTMTELKTELDKVADTYYLDAPIGTKVPYIVYTWDDDPNFPADDVIYQKIAAITINFYFTDFTLMNAVDSALDSLGLFYSASCVYDSDAKVNIKTYTLEVIDNG